jgi:predicted dehydrogenase
MATSASVASDMVSEAQRAGVANMVDFEFPEIEAWRRAKSILDSGSLGPLRHIAVVWNVETYANRHGLRSWKTSAEGGGGVLNAFVSHAFYYLEWFVGSIGRLSARLLRMPGDERTGDTLAVLCLELESGLPVSISVSSHAFLGSGHRVEFYGQEGTLMLDNRTADYIQGFKLFYGTRASNRLEVVASDDPKDTVTIDGRIDAVARLTKRFVNWIKTGLPSAPNFQDGLRVQKLLEAAWLSHQAGGIVQEVSYRI